MFIELNSSTDIKVNIVKAYVVTEDRHGNKKSTIVGVWATDISVDKDNVVDITRAARSRWMIENQCFNTLKNQGYCLEHNYGHGQKNLSFNFCNLILLSFTIHQIQQLTDKVFQKVKILYKANKYFWESILELFKWLLFDSWDHLMMHMIAETEDTS